MDATASIKRLVALACVLVGGLVSLVGSGGGGGESEAPPPAGTRPTVLMFTAAPHSKAWVGQAYESSLAASASTGEPVRYQLGAQAPVGLALDPASGALTWAVPAAASPGKRTFDVTARSASSGASRTQQVSIDVVTPNVIVDAAVTNAGGTFADKSGSFRVTVPPDSLRALGVDGRAVIQTAIDSEGRRVIRTRYAGFKAGTRLTEIFPRPAPLAPAMTSTKEGIAAAAADIVTFTGIPGTRGQLHEPFVKRPGFDDQLVTNVYVPLEFAITPTIPEEDAAAEGQIYDSTRTEVSDVAVLRRHTSGTSTKPAIIFVHGFKANPLKAWNECPFGGEMEKGETWGKANALVDRLAEHYEVYEFQWRTCQPFEAAAATLGFAIKGLVTSGRANGKKVTIFAHSFGGVLVSTLLQKRFRGGFVPDIDPQALIQAVYFFDSPLSGIARTANRTEIFPQTPGALPNGRVRDDWSIGLCRQVTCFQMGHDDGGAGAELKRVMRMYFTDAIATTAGAFAKELVAGWASFQPAAAAFSINAVFTDYPRRYDPASGSYVDQSSQVELVEPGDALIDNRGTALDFRHFQHKDGEPLPPEAVGPTIKSLDKFKHLHQLQRYYSAAEPGKEFAKPWVEEKPLTPDTTTSIKVYRVLSDRYPATERIPRFVNYYFATGDFWSHTEFAFVNKVDDTPDLATDRPGVVRFEPSGKHLLEFFILKAASEAGSVGLLLLAPPADVSLVGRVVDEGGSRLGAIPYGYTVFCTDSAVERLIDGGWSSTRADGTLSTNVRFNTGCSPSALRVRLTVGDSILYRQYTDVVPVSGSGGVYQAVFNSGLNIRLIRMSDILNKPDTDMIFLTDLSGSYGDDLATFQSLSSAILNEARDNGARVRVGVASFVDFESWTGFAGDYPYFLWSDLNYDLAPARSALARMYIAGGGDIPESQLWALYNLTFLTWAGGSQRIVAMATDASFHDRDVEPGYPGVGYALTISALRAKGIKVYILVPGGVAIPALTKLAADTGGRVLDAGSGSSAVVCSFRAIFNGTSSSACTTAAASVQGATAPFGANSAGRSNR